MKSVERTDIVIIQNHLKSHSTGVGLPLDFVKAEECQAFKVRLEEVDVKKLVLWFEFKKYTTDESCKITDIVAAGYAQERVQRFIVGHPQKGYGPADLKTSHNLQPVVVTDSLESEVLYLIDGNHRTIAQHVTNKGFQDVEAFVCIHPNMLRWPYIPRRYRSQK